MVISTVDVVDGVYIGKHNLSKFLGDIVIETGVTELKLHRLLCSGNLLIADDFTMHGDIMLPTGRLTCQGKLTAIPAGKAQGNIYAGNIQSHKITCVNLVASHSVEVGKSIVCTEDICVGQDISAGVTGWFPDEHRIRCRNLLKGNVVCGELITDADLYRANCAGLGYPAMASQ